MIYTAKYGTTNIDFLLFRSVRKSLSIEVHPDLTVKILAPLNAAFDEIEKRVIKRGGWIIKQQRYFESFLPRTPQREYISGETHLYLGRRYLLKIAREEKNEVKLKGGCLKVSIGKDAINTTARNVLAGWYKSRSEKILLKHLLQNLKSFQKYDVSEPPLLIKRMKNRWGSKTSSGKIVLNPELIKAPLKCIDYVIIHELCHFIRPQHNKLFYQLQEKMMPDWKRWKDRLESIMS